MIKRTIEISQQPAHLTVRDRQLVLRRRRDDAAETRSREGGAEDDPIASIPCEDVGILLVDHAGTTYGHAALVCLLECDAAVVVCGRDHLPAGMLLPFGRHSQVVARLGAQLSAPRPLCKQLWRQIVRAKIRAQADNLAAGSAARTRLREIVREVRSGDASNAEAQAAKVYWAAWRDSLRGPGGEPDQRAGETPANPFRRDPDGPPPNDLLNYGYAVLRAAVARAIVAAGMLPALGLHHTHRSNAFCLADDLLEPLRPLVDDRVRELLRQGHVGLSPAAKRGVLELLTAEVRVDEQTGPLMVGLHRYVASLTDCFAGAAKTLRIPVAVEAPCT